MEKYKKIILGIESSCDETSAAVVRVKCQMSNVKCFEILSNIVLSQIDIHKKYGGVVPEVAARSHIKNILPVIQGALDEACVSQKDIDAIAVTNGPGLITSLMVGAETAKTLAYLWQKPIVAVNHLKAHIYAAWLQEAKSYKLKAISFPVLALVVSGGHTELVFMKNEKSFKKIGQTLDDAAGEVFDKVAKILDLGYPGGPIISKYAESGNPQAFAFPRPIMDSKDFNFSFSGLKTSVLYKVQEIKRQEQKKFQVSSFKFQENIAASFQQSVVDVLVYKTIKATQQYKVKTLIMGGGVAANKLLRQTMKSEAEKNGVPCIIPEIRLCTDNAAPIAVAGYFGKPIPWQKIDVDPGLDISEN